jgi:hypothetical protein
MYITCLLHASSYCVLESHFTVTDKYACQLEENHQHA